MSNSHQNSTSEKFESLRLVAAGIAHRLNNDLCSILGHAELLRPFISDNPRASQLLDSIIHSGTQAAETINSLHLSTGSYIRDSKAVSLAIVAEQCRHTIETNIPQGVDVEFVLSTTELHVDGDASQIRMIFLALLNNSIESFGNQIGRVTVRTDFRRYSADDLLEEELVIGTPEIDGEYMELVVSDTGCGMDAAARMNMFDPFYSTKFFGRGLSLSTVAGIVRSHAGIIFVHSKLQHGTTIRILFSVLRYRSGL